MIAANAQAKISKEPWVNPFKEKERILEIWRTPRQYLQGEDERKVYKLLMKYNGTYAAYAEQIEAKMSRQKNSAHQGKHIKWEVGVRVLSQPRLQY